MSSCNNRNAVLPSGDWLDVLCRDGYFVCNLGPLTDAELQRVALEVTSLGENFVIGPITEVKSVPSSRYVTLTNSAAPFHNDGSYRSEPPRYIILYCQTASQEGGMTLLARGDEVANRLDAETRRILEQTNFHVRLAAWTATRKLLMAHPKDGTPVIFFGEPAISPDSQMTADDGVQVEPILESIRAILRDPQVICYRHCWQPHDLLVFDNFKVIHGRTAFQGDRLLRRVEIGPDLRPATPASVSTTLANLALQFAAKN